MNPTAPRVMLFDLYSGGHHLQYIQYLADYWTRRDAPGALDLVVPAAFVAAHPSLAAFATRHADAGLRLVPIEEAVHVETARPFQLVRNDLEHGRLLRKYVTALRPDHCVLMYFDHAQLSLALDLTFDFPVQFSGIYFRPSFHYDLFAHDRAGLKERLQRLRKRALLAAALRNRHMAYLFCLDPFAPPRVEALRPGVRAVALPDGVVLRPGGATRSETRARWGVAADRTVALFFGFIDARKGIYRVLEALALLPEATQTRLALVLAGPISDVERRRVLAGVETLKKTSPVQFVVEDRFVPDAEVQGLMRGADVVLLPYQHHVGSSNVLVRAAAAGRPVLGADYGLVGEQIRRRTLGLALDATSPRALADGLARFVAQPGRLPFNAEAARRFADENTAERFAETIFRHVAVSVFGGKLPG